MPINNDPDRSYLRDLAAEIGTSPGRLMALLDIVVFAGAGSADWSDGELDAFWAKVDGDRETFGLSTGVITGLSLHVIGPLKDHIIKKSDPMGVGPTSLTPYGRWVIRRLLQPRKPAQNDGS
jgi:hypothetical protein